MTDPLQPPLPLADLDRRELQSTIFACVAIAVMGIGSALLMYPVVFTHSATPDWSPRIAFFGFCGLCVLLTAYVWDSHATIRRLRRQMDLDRKQSTKARMEASEDLLKSLPKLNSFQDQLPMEYRRSAATDRQLSILVLTFQFGDGSTPAAANASILGDAAKAIARKLREEDSMYVLGPACFGAILPAVESSGARNLASRIAEGLINIPGSSGRFTYKIDVVNYPQNASSAHELFEAVTALLPHDRSMEDHPANALV
jgi:GGDEF domain-containing protein